MFYNSFVLYGEIIYILICEIVVKIVLGHSSVCSNSYLNLPPPHAIVIFIDIMCARDSKSSARSMAKWVGRAGQHKGHLQSAECVVVTVDVRQSNVSARLQLSGLSSTCSLFAFLVSQIVDCPSRPSINAFEYTAAIHVCHYLCKTLVTCVNKQMTVTFSSRLHSGIIETIYRSVILIFLPLCTTNIFFDQNEHSLSYLLSANRLQDQFQVNFSPSILPASVRRRSISKSNISCHVTCL